MKEDFLHFLWRTRRFEQQQLLTTEGEALEILHPGDYNTHAGADFQNARLRIGDTLWAGSVEMHLRSSDWLAHRHQDDPAYRNVILHVVMEEDLPVRRPSGERIACLEMRQRVPPQLDALYQKLLHNEHWIPCQHHFHAVSDMTKTLWLDRLTVERLEQKTAAIRHSLEETGQNWEETFYRHLARNFGLKVNAEPFEALAKSLPQKILSKHRDNLLQIEALLFGQAGLLERDFEEAYPLSLQREYRFLRQKYGLSPIAGASWKFLRLHPANFPTIRLAQFAKLAQQSHALFSKVLETEALKDLEALFDLRLEGYWLTHYTFGSESPRRNKSLGKDAIRLLLINTVVPFLFVYGAEKANPSYKELALKLLEQLPPEQNALLEGWERLGLKADSAARTQAMLQLKNEYCAQKKCLQCAIGGAILR